MAVTLIELVVWLIVGLLAGSLAGLVVKRKKEGFGRYANSWRQSTLGAAGTENGAEALFDAMRRKEVYGAVLVHQDRAYTSPIWYAP